MKIRETTGRPTNRSVRWFVPAPRRQSTSATPVERQAPQAARDRILDAAETVVLRDGMGRLTLDAIARACGLSKPGLLHHFSSKDLLISAMVERHVRTWHDEFLATYNRLKSLGESRPAVMAMMSTCLSGEEAWSEAERARNRVMVAALVHDERQVEPLRHVFREVQVLVSKDHLPPGAGEAIHLAVHGLWFQWIFAMGDISSDRLKNIRQALASIGGFDLSASKPKPRTRATKSKATLKRGVR